MEIFGKVRSFARDIFWSFLLDALLTIAAGIFILLYPDILGMVVGAVFIVIGVKGIIFALKINSLIQKISD